MTNEIYGFYSSTGETLGGRLINGVIQDIRDDRVSRNAALDRIAETIERIAAMEGMPLERDTFDSLASRLAPVFRTAGFLPMSGTDIRNYCDTWSNRGVASNPASVCAEAVIRADRATKAINTVIARLSKHPRLQVASTLSTPWENGFCTPDGRAPGDVVIFPWKEETGCLSYIGCITIGEEGASYLEDAISETPQRLMDEGVFLPRPTKDAQAIMLDLKNLQGEITNYNLAAVSAKEPIRLSLSVDPNSPAVFQTLWDGEPLVMPQKKRSLPESALEDAVQTLDFAEVGAMGMR